MSMRLGSLPKNSILPSLALFSCRLAVGSKLMTKPFAPKRWMEEHVSYEGNECISWPFEVSRYGYGIFNHNGKRRVASRVMCEMAHGLPDDDFKDAAHSCGNGHKGCMNPNHLRWASRSENMSDAVRSGSYHAGRIKASWSATKSRDGLTPEKVREIRRLASTMMQKEIGAKFGLPSGAVSRIVNRKRWAWVDD